MCIAHVHHSFENIIPSVRFLQRIIGEHTAVPANVLDAAFGSVLEPIAGAAGDVQLAIRIVGRAMLAGLVVTACPVHFTIMPIATLVLRIPIERVVGDQALLQ